MEAIGWMGLWAAPEVPAAVQARLRDAAIKLLADAGTRSRLLDTGFEAGSPRTQDDMVQGLKTDYDRVGGVLKSINFKPE